MLPAVLRQKLRQNLLNNAFVNNAEIKVNISEMTTLSEKKGSIERYFVPYNT